MYGSDKTEDEWFEGYVIQLLNTYLTDSIEKDFRTNIAHYKSYDRKEPKKGNVGSRMLKE